MEMVETQTYHHFCVKPVQENSFKECPASAAEGAFCANGFEPAEDPICQARLPHYIRTCKPSTWQSLVRVNQNYL